MMSQTHLLIGAAAFTRQGQTLRNCAVLVGAMIPDVSMYLLYGMSRMDGVPSQQFWRVLYWQDPSQFYNAISNSFPLFGALLLAGVLMQRANLSIMIENIGYVLAAFALGALLHLSFDFPVHANDAHRHFWPFTDWRFFSPLSYWDSRHFADYVRVAEAVIGIVSAIILIRRFKNIWVRIITVLMLSSYILVPTYFYLVLS